MSIVNHEPLVVALRYITHDPTPPHPHPNIMDITQPRPHPLLERYIICARPLTADAQNVVLVLAQQ